MTSLTNLVFRAPHRATARDDTLEFEIVEPWYRSLPISCITGLEVWIDGQSIAQAQLTLDIAGEQRSIAECADTWQQYWPIREPATVRVRAVSVGPTARVKARLGLRIPYIMIGPETALPRHVVQEETFEVAAS
ncbi:MAG: DUF6379 domain-containing protein [Streptosporangiaceae bacterium]